MTARSKSESQITGTSTYCNGQTPIKVDMQTQYYSLATKRVRGTMQCVLIAQSTFFLSE